MAALPYMQLYIADYLADTMHLSTEEHGAYLLLMFNYWQTGKPIPKTRLSKIARVPAVRWPEIESVLSEFFESDGESWIHLRIERDIENVVSAPRGKKLPNGDTLSGYSGYVYFITAPDSELVKIGYSKNPWARIGELRRSHGNNLAVVATVKTKQKSEVSVHTILSNFRTDGEWFQKSDCIKSLISAISEASVTTVEAISNYVENYGVATTTTTNKDTDTDTDKEKNKDLKNLPGAGKAQLPAEEVFITLPLNDGTEFEISLEYVAELSELYPAVNVPQELRNQRGWISSNPKNRKTKTGIKRFVTSWLAKAQNSAPRATITGGSHGNSATGSTGASAVQQVRDARNADRIRQGLAPLGNDGADLRQSVGQQEWGDSLSALDSSDFDVLG